MRSPPRRSSRHMRAGSDMWSGRDEFARRTSWTRPRLTAVTDWKGRREADPPERAIGSARDRRRARARRGSRSGAGAQRLLRDVARDREDGDGLRAEVDARQGAESSRSREAGRAEAAAGGAASDLPDRDEPARCAAAARLCERGNRRGGRARRQRLRARGSRGVRRRGLCEPCRAGRRPREPDGARAGGARSREGGVRHARARSPCRASGSASRRSARSSP